MKPVKNERHTKWDVGDIIVSRYHRYRLRPAHYMIVGFAPCSLVGNPPCHDCSSGAVLYVAKRFNKRLGRVEKSICGTYHEKYPEYYQIDPITREIIGEERS